MTLGQNIKKLRRNADMTQEELAEMLCISSQAVSRWEVGTAMPDISLLPSLCNIFNVSSDVLLGIDSVGKQAEIDKVRTKAHSFSSRGYFEEARAILEDGLQKFPNDYFIIRDLMFVADNQSSDENYAEEQRNAFLQESINLAERILKSCSEDNLRHSAIQVLCFAYKDMGNIEKAKELAYKMPDMILSRQSLVARVSLGDQRYTAKQNELDRYVMFLELGIRQMDVTLDNGRQKYTPEEMSLLREKAIALLNLIFEDGNFGFYHTHLADTHSDQAKYYAKAKCADKTLYHLEKAAEHAISFDNWCESDTREYTCLLFKDKKVKGFTTSDKRNDALKLLEELKDSKFDFVNENVQFVAVKENLEKFAKVWQPQNG